MKGRSLTGVAILAVWPVALYAGSTITIVNTDAAGQGLNDPTPAVAIGGNAGTTLGQQRLNALQYAASLWSVILDSPIEIRIQAKFANLTCDSTSAVLARTGPIQLLSDFVPNAGFPGPEVAGVWYPVALGNRRSGRDLLPGSDDIATTINSRIGQTGCGFHFYLGLDGQAGADVDLVTVMLHEYAHGFGFLTEVDLSSGAEFQGRQDLFERFIYDKSAGKVWTDMTGAERVASAVNAGNIAYLGPAVTATVPGVMKGTPTLKVSAPSSVSGNYAIGRATFGPALTDTGVSGQLVAALDPSDGAGASTFDACSSLTNASAVAGKIALIDRGTCTFVSKTLNAQAAGAIGVVVADNVDGAVAGMGGTDPTVVIAAVRVTKADGAKLRAALDSGVAVKLFLDDSRLAGTDGSGHLLLYAPTTLVNGSSISHWDTSDVPDLLLEPFISADPGHGVDLTLAALRDFGWYADIPSRQAIAPAHRLHETKTEPPRP